MTYTDEENRKMQEEFDLEEMEIEINKEGLSEDDIETLELYLDKKIFNRFKKLFRTLP